jgi:hypothetical protein
LLWANIHTSHHVRQQQLRSSHTRSIETLHRHLGSIKPLCEQWVVGV